MTEQNMLTPASAPRRAALTGLLVIVGAAALAAGVYVSQRAPTQPVPINGAAVYDVTLPDVDGQSVSLAKYRGKPLVVNFWASWCAPCREEMPAFVEMQRTDGKTVQFVGIGVDDGAKLKLFADSIQLNYPALVGGYGALELSRSWGNAIMALPFTVVLDAKGTVVHTQLGPLPTAKLKNILAQMG